MRKLALLLCLIAASGCAHNQITVNDPIVIVPIFRTNSQAVAVIVAVEYGYAGYCAGANLDADLWRILAEQNGYDAVVLRDEDATKGNVVNAVLSAFASISPTGRVLITYSGHGGQVPDTGGDEDDGKDELICLQDQALTDDEMGAILSQAPAGLRVLAVFDSCHSGTMPRRARGLRVARDTAIHAQVVVYAGCSDANLSYGTAENGGTWTGALVMEWTQGGHYGRDGWFDDAAAVMPDYQVPVYGEYGPVTDEYRQTRGMK